MQSIYLDHNATTPLLPEVLAAMADCATTAFANPESQHQPGQRARRVLEDAREGMAALLGADLSGPHPDRLIFTSGGTEANNLALLGLAAASVAEREKRCQEPNPRNQSVIAESPDDLVPDTFSSRIVISAIEHPSVARPAEQLARHGWRMERLPVSDEGVVSVESFEQLLGDSPTLRLASVMLANNETGVVQPVERLATLAAAAGVPLHTDAAQAVGKLPVDFRKLGVAALSCAAHKFHGPRGIGALLVRGEVRLEPLLWGGFHQQGLRPGTECVVLAVGMHAALASFSREQTERLARLARLRDRFEARLRTGWPGEVINGREAERLPNTASVAFPSLDRQALVMALDLAGVACSTGSACASGSSEPSPTLRAMGLSEPVVQSSLRFSLGATTTEAEIDAAAAVVVQVVQSQATRAIRPDGSA